MKNISLIRTNQKSIKTSRTYVVELMLLLSDGDYKQNNHGVACSMSLIIFNVILRKEH